MRVFKLIVKAARHVPRVMSRKVGELSPVDLVRWLTEASGDGVRYAAFSPDRENHLGAEPQAVLSLKGLSGRGPESVFQELTALARG